MTESAALAISARAYQIYLIGADYTATPSIKQSRPGKNDPFDFWPQIRGMYRCDTYVLDSYATVRSVYQEYYYSGGDLYGRSIQNEPSNWMYVMSNILFGSLLPRSVYDSIANNLK